MRAFMGWRRRSGSVGRIGHELAEEVRVVIHHLIELLDCVHELVVTVVVSEFGFETQRFAVKRNVTQECQRVRHRYLVLELNEREVRP